MEKSTYIVVVCDNTTEFMQKVSRFIAKGYQLQGGVAVASDGPVSGQRTYIQALVLIDRSGEQKSS